MSKTKNQAKRLTQISKKYGYDIKHTHALEILSQLEGETSRHTQLAKEKEANKPLLDEEFQRKLLFMFLNDKKRMDQLMGLEKSPAKHFFSGYVYKVFSIVSGQYKRNQNFKIEAIEKEMRKKPEKVKEEFSKIKILDSYGKEIFVEFFVTYMKQIKLLEALRIVDDIDPTKRANYLEEVHNEISKIK